MQTLGDNRCQTRLLYTASHAITIDEETKMFYDRTKFKQCISSNAGLQEDTRRKPPT